jgi:hypothetical protein
MKPHEETWEVEEQYLKDFGEVLLVDKPDGWTICSVDSREDEPELAEHRGRFIAAAPAMARALLAHVAYCVPCKGSGSVGVRTTMGAVPQPCPACEADRAALKEAGVLE